MRDALDAQLTSEQYEAGFGRVHQLAVKVLLEIYPEPAELAERLASSLDLIEAHAVAEARTDAYLDGVQKARAALVEALGHRNAT